MITPPCAVGSPIRAAGIPAMSTVVEPMPMVSGGPTQTHMSPVRAANIPAIITVGAPMLIGPPTCGTGPGFTKGQVCISPNLAAGFPIIQGDFELDSISNDSLNIHKNRMLPAGRREKISGRWSCPGACPPPPHTRRRSPQRPWRASNCRLQPSKSTQQQFCNIVA
jgi:hypothetical protein